MAIKRPITGKAAGSLARKRLGKQKKDSNKKTFTRRKRSPMEKERVLSTMKSKAQELGGNVRSREEMEAATKGLKTLTNKGPGRLKLALKVLKLGYFLL